jgi:hypothetical protein
MLVFMTAPVAEKSIEDNSQRAPLGRRDKTAVSATLLRVVGRESKTPALDVAAFNSFAD